MKTTTTTIRSKTKTAQQKEKLGKIDSFEAT